MAFQVLSKRMLHKFRLGAILKIVEKFATLLVTVFGIRGVEQAEVQKDGVMDKTIKEHFVVLVEEAVIVKMIQSDIEDTVDIVKSGRVCST
jgi:hypothetical protein